MEILIDRELGQQLWLQKNQKLLRTVNHTVYLFMSILRQEAGLFEGLFRNKQT